MNDDKKSSFFKIAGCVSVYMLFVVIIFNVTIPTTPLVLLSTLVGSMVVVASYHEYRGTLILRVPSKSKAKAKSSFIEPRAIPSTESSMNATAQQTPEVVKCDDGLPTFDLAMFAPEVLKKVSDLHVDDDIQDEIFNALKDIPPEQRLRYVDDIFQTSADFDATY
jgi:hypothetical protein